jgi:hypothetical protein
VRGEKEKEKGKANNHCEIKESPLEIKNKKIRNRTQSFLFLMCFSDFIVDSAFYH